MVTDTMAVQSIDGESFEGTGRILIDHAAIGTRGHRHD